MSTNTPRFFSFTSGLAFGERKDAAILRSISVLRLRKAQPQVLAAAAKFGPFAGERPRREKLLFKQGWERKRRTKISTSPLSASQRKGGEKGNRNGADGGAPAPAAFKLRFYHLLQGAAANGTRARRPANHRRASSGCGPMAARVLGAWAKGLLSLGRGVWAGVGVDSWLSCTWPHLCS